MQSKDEAHMAAAHFFSMRNEHKNLIESLQHLEEEINNNSSHNLSSLLSKRNELIEEETSSTAKLNRVYNKLCDLIYQPILATSKKVLRNHDDAMDNTSKVLMKLYTNENFVFSDDKPFLGYVMTVAHNSAKNEYNKNKRRKVMTVDDEGSGESILECMNNNHVMGSRRTSMRNMDDEHSWIDIDWEDSEQAEDQYLKYQTPFLRGDNLIKPTHYTKINTDFEHRNQSSQHEIFPAGYDPIRAKFDFIIEFIRDNFEGVKFEVIKDGIINRLDLDNSLMSGLSCDNDKELNYEQIAAKHGFDSTGAVKTLMHRAKKVIRKAVIDNFGDSHEINDGTDDMNGVVVLKYNGKNRFRYTMSQGVLHGKAEYFHEDGKTIRKSLNYYQGKPSGLCKEFYPDGVVRKHGIYTNGKTDGVWSSYDEEGNLIAVQEYYHGESGYFEIYFEHETVVGIDGYSDREIIPKSRGKICQANVKELTA